MMRQLGSISLKGCHVIETNVTGTLYLIQKVGRDMRERGNGRSLSPARSPASFLVRFKRSITARKHSFDSFSFALRNE